MRQRKKNKLFLEKNNLYFWFKVFRLNYRAYRLFFFCTFAYYSFVLLFLRFHPNFMREFLDDSKKTLFYIRSRFFYFCLFFLFGKRLRWANKKAVFCYVRKHIKSKFLYDLRLKLRLKFQSGFMERGLILDLARFLINENIRQLKSKKIYSSKDEEKFKAFSWVKNKSDLKYKWKDIENLKINMKSLSYSKEEFDFFVDEAKIIVDKKLDEFREFSRISVIKRELSRHPFFF